MPDVALDRSQRAAPVRAIGGGEARDLDRVAQRRGGAVALDEAHRVGRHTGIGQRGADRVCLPADRGRGEAHLGGAVVVDPDAPDHRVDAVAVALGILQPLQHHDARAVREDGAARLGVEGTAQPVGRDHPALLVQVAALFGEGDRDPARQHRVGLSRAQHGHGLHDGDEAGRTGGRDRQRRAAQAQLPRDAGHQPIAVVAAEGDVVLDLVAAGEGFQRGAVVHQVLQQVGRHRRARDDADPRIGPVRIDGGVFQRVQAEVEEDARLRIGFRGLGGQHLPVARVEARHVVEQPARRHVAGRAAVEPVLDLRRVQPGDRRAARAGQFREGVEGVGPRHPHRHAGDRDRARAGPGRGDGGGDRRGVEAAGEVGDAGRLEQQGQVEPAAEPRLQPGMRLDQVQRGAARLEEGRALGEGGQAQHLGEDGGDGGGQVAGLRRRHRRGGGRGEQRLAVDLARGGQRKGVEHPQVARQHPARRGRGQPVQQRARVERRPRGGDHGPLHRAGAALSDDRHGGIGHARGGAQQRLDRVQFDPVAVQLHLPVGAAEELVRAIGTAAGEVAGQVDRAGPAGARIGDEAGGGLVRAVQVAERDAGARDGQLPGLALRQDGQVVAKDQRLLGRQRAPDRDRAVQIGGGDAVRQRVGAGLGRAEVVDQHEVGVAAQQLAGMRHAHHVAARHRQAQAREGLGPVVDHQVVQARVPVRDGHARAGQRVRDGVERRVGAEREGPARQERREGLPCRGIG